jgi:hypothetical protein
MPLERSTTARPRKESVKMATGDNLILGERNTAEITTLLEADAPLPTPFPVVLIMNPTGVAVYVAMGDTGIYASVPSGTAVAGGSDNGPGVVGDSLNTVGTAGYSDKGIGVYGKGVTGIYGEGVTGVLGTAAGNGVGVYGSSETGHALEGISRHGVALFAGTGDGTAGLFWGPVTVVGGLTVFGAKSAAVRHRDGSYRLLYSIESPESWFEDFGTSKLVNGRATIKLPADFAAVVRLGTYHVFLTPEGESNGLYVRSKSKRAFQVCEQRKGKSNLRFSYRIVAKRNDVAGRRFAKVMKPERPPSRQSAKGLDLASEVQQRRRRRGQRVDRGEG